VPRRRRTAMALMNQISNSGRAPAGPSRRLGPEPPRYPAHAERRRGGELTEIMTTEERRLPILWWQLADEFRGQSERLDPLALLRAGVDRGLGASWPDISRIAQSTRETAELVDPAVVANLLLALTSDEPPKRVLDPWAGLGITLAALESQGRVASGLAIEINEGVHKLAQELWPASEIERRQGDAAEILADLAGEFDLVVGSPPPGLSTVVLRSTRPEIDLTASKTYTMLVQAALALAPQGRLVAVLPEGFFAPRNAPIHAALAAANAYPCAAFALPLRDFPTSIPMSLVCFAPEPQDELFAAELDAATDFTAVVANWRARREGALPQLGRFVPVATFVSWRSIVLNAQIEDAARGTGLLPVSIAQLCSEMHAPRRAGDPFDPLPNALYLPKLGTSPAVTSVDAMLIKPHNYVQLVLRSDIVDPEFLAAFFNAPLGRKVREQLGSGTTIPQISLATLRAGMAYLPPSISQQRAAVRVGRTLTELIHSITGLERQLWEHPLAASRTEAELRRLIEGDGLERWTESLPFPLASILWRYQATRDAERRCQYLVHFFEAAAVFLVDLHLSALHRDPQVLAEAARHRPGDVSYARSSIGIWADLLSRLAKSTRDLLSHDRLLALELFRVNDLGRLVAVSRKSVVLALKDEAAGYRRNWIGHSAVVGAAEWERRIAQAEATLARVIDGLGDVFVGWELVRAGEGKNRHGVITTNVEHLMGSRSLFRQGSVGLREWPEDGGQYMLETGSSVMLRLGPLFRLRRGPESVEDACYFYDRIETNGVRWVSYHYEPQPELVFPDSETVDLIRELDALG
jgi:hypothetical protein